MAFRRLLSKLLDQDKINTKSKNTLFERYGVNAASRINISQTTLNILDDKELFCEYVNGKTRKDIIDDLKIGDFTLYLYAKKYDALSLIKRSLVSQFEIDISNFLTEHNISYQQNVRNIIYPQELDFYLPNHNIAIECSGIYWHSELSAGRSISYHANKHDKCKNLGIQLITIFDDEWRNKKNIVKNILTNILIPNKKVIFAKNCKISNVTKEQEKEFLNNNHIQGYVSSKIRLGLFHNDTLITLMSFGSSRFEKTSVWELLRYSSTERVVGGAAKLLKHFITDNSPNMIVSYSDNRWFTGKMYESLGFKNTTEKIGYFYTDYHNRFNRFNFQKHKLVKEGYDPTKSEWEIMQERKFDRIWDCGQKRWELKLQR